MVLNTVLWRSQQGGNRTFMCQLVVFADGVLEPCEPRTELPSCPDTQRQQKLWGLWDDSVPGGEGGDLLSHSLRPCCCH